MFLHNPEDLAKFEQLLIDMNTTDREHNGIDSLPLISVIIPTYGARGALAKAVASALDQSFGNVEVIVVDDNPPESDGRKATEETMAQFATNPAVKYIRHSENRNGAAARNTGLRHADGDYIAFLDDDDSFLPPKLERQLDFLNRHPEFDAAYCFASKNGKQIKCFPYEGSPSFELLVGKTFMPTPSLLFRKGPLLDIGGFDESFRRHQDYELLLKFFNRGYSIGCLREPLVDIGSNAGENIPHGEKLMELKRKFLDTFADVIDNLETERPGARKRIETHHHYAIFLDALRTGSIRRAWHEFATYFPKSPSTFCHDLAETVKAHMK